MNITTVAAVAAAVIGLAQAQEVSLQNDAAARINIAGKQRMLSQRAASAACFAAIDSDEPGHIRRLDETLAAFDAGLVALIEGNAKLGLAAETRKEVLFGLNEVEKAWSPFRRAAKDAVGQGRTSPSNLQTIVATNLSVLGRMNEVVELLETLSETSGSVNPTRARTINVAGRQRMLAHKASKEFCFAVAGIEPADNRAALNETLHTFETVLTDLKAGTGGLVEPRPVTVQKLERVAGLISAARPAYAAVLNGEMPEDAVVTAIPERTDRLVQRMNEIVYSYSLSSM